MTLKGLHKRIFIGISAILLFSILLSNISFQGDWVQDLIGDVSEASFPSDFETQAEENEIEENTFHSNSSECLPGFKTLKDGISYMTCIAPLIYNYNPEIPTPPPEV